VSLYSGPADHFPLPAVRAPTENNSEYFAGCVFEKIGKARTRYLFLEVFSHERTNQVDENLISKNAGYMM